MALYRTTKPLVVKGVDFGNAIITIPAGSLVGVDDLIPRSGLATIRYEGGRVRVPVFELTGNIALAEDE